MANVLSARQLWGFSYRAAQMAGANCTMRQIPQSSVVRIFRSLCVSPATNVQKAGQGVTMSASPATPATRPLRQRKAVITVSDRAAARVAELMQKKDPKPLGLRLGVRTRGCNGLSYTMNYVDAVPKNDDIVEVNGVKIFVDPKAVMYLVGCRMDFVEDAVKAEFVFENPNAKGSCGCGESFNV